jgi:hypothetical protein
MGLEDLCQRPERRFLPVGERPALAPIGGLGAGIQFGGEFKDKAALPNARVAGQSDELGCPLLPGLVEGV